MYNTITKHELDYIISNGKFAAAYLQGLSESSNGLNECRKAFNSGLAVAQLIKTVETLYNQNLDLFTRLGEKDRKIRDYENKEFKPFLDEEIAKFKRELTEIIEAYPNIDYEV